MNDKRSDTIWIICFIQIFSTNCNKEQYSFPFVSLHSIKIWYLLLLLAETIQGKGLNFKRELCLHLVYVWVEVCILQHTLHPRSTTFTNAIENISEERATRTWCDPFRVLSCTEALVAEWAVSLRRDTHFHYSPHTHMQFSYSCFLNPNTKVELEEL